MFTCILLKSFENTVGKGEMLITNNFSFSDSVFYPFGDLSPIFNKVKIVVCKLVQFGRVQNFTFGKGLIILHEGQSPFWWWERFINPLPDDKILRLVQIESTCRRQSKCDWKNWKFVSWMVENIVGKGENAGYQHFLLFPRIFSFFHNIFLKGVSVGVFKSQDCVVKS